MPLLECLLGAAAPTLSSTTYNFDRDAHGRYVCEVNDLVHIQCLISCGTYAYAKDVVVEPEPEPAPVPPPVSDHIETLIGSDKFASVIVLPGGTTMTLGDLVSAAHTESGISIAEWNTLEDDARDALIDRHLEKLVNAATVPPTPDATPAADPAATPDAAPAAVEQPASQTPAPAADEEAATAPVQVTRRGRGRRR